MAPKTPGLTRPRTRTRPPDSLPGHALTAIERSRGTSMLPRQMATRKKPKAVEAAPKALDEVAEELDVDEEPDVDLHADDALETLDDTREDEDDDDDIAPTADEDEDEESAEILTPSPA